jgi:hypothetical protein
VSVVKQFWVCRKWTKIEIVSYGVEMFCKSNFRDDFPFPCCDVSDLLFFHFLRQNGEKLVRFEWNQFRDVFYCIKKRKCARRVDRRKMKRAKTCLKYLLKCLCLLNKQQPNKEPVYFNCFEMNPWNYITVTSPQMNRFYNLAKIKNFLFSSLFHRRIFQKCETTC